MNSPLLSHVTRPESPEAFRFVSADNMPIKPACWLVRDYIEENALAVLYGQPGKGKSFIALDMSCCIATGTDFHGHKVTAGAVFYIAGEGHNGLARRLHAWSQHSGRTLENAPLFISEGATDLANEENATRVAEAVKRLTEMTGNTPVLIVIDTLARNFGGDENSAADMGKFVRHVDMHLRNRWKATTLIVHHSGKDGDRGARGSSALKGAADAEYEVSRQEGDKLIRLTPRKMKDAEEPPPLAFELVVIPLHDDSGNPIAGAALRLAEYKAPAVLATSGMGKNQRAALTILENMYKEIPSRQCDLDRQHQTTYILADNWQERCKTEGIERNRFPEARDALIKRGAIYLDGQNVVLQTKPYESSEPPQ